ncbi:MAG: 50S ribosomal protein L22 [bacterium]
MKVKAQAKYLRAAPRKVRMVADVIRGKRVKEALMMLSFLPNLGAKLIAKVLKSAVANAKNNYKLGEDKLFVSEIYIDGATPFKRVHPRARGSAYPILKRQSHITIYVEEASSGPKSPS